MKKSIKRLLSCILSGVMAGSCFVAADAAEVMYGDVDKNGAINSSDALIVLTNTVGARELTAEETKLSDVDANGVINSSDALDILLYSVGSLTKFKAELPDAPKTGDEMLAIYANAVKKARKELPSYRIEINTESKDADLNVTGLIPVSKKDLEQMKSDMEGTDYYRTTCPQKSSLSASNLPAECLLKDSSKLKSIKTEVLQNGNFKIDIKFNDEKNPKSDSPLCKAFGMVDFASMEETISSSAEIEGMSIPVELKEMNYKNSWISCEINPETGEFVSLDWNFDAVMVTNIPLGIATIASSVTETENAHYWDFGY